MYARDPRDAGLPRCRKNAGEHARLRLLEVRIVEDDVRALAAELEHAADEALACSRRNRAAGTDAPRKGDLGDQRVIDERFARFPEAADDVDDAWRNAGGFCQPGELDG